ncbi:aldo/keto reductase [Cognatilysobacter bugurensis]|uniref:Oxidoreductase n=1 Tax=Cognatilysobacter bugurensis TaxID=543356 RepID=A0A918T0T9_9GAMM|nr:aldo/keto reductase [Lysobacter bugurensis]GHA83556.1 oxidoreductase [Lysobacter bugurensis]
MSFDTARFENPAGLSPIVAGCWRMADWGLDAAERVRWIEGALALGVSAFDHADLYGDYRVEALFGDALAAAPGLRDRLQLVTKCGIRLVSAQRPAHRVKSYDTSRAHVTASVEESLRSLRTDRIDLLLIHRPDALMNPADLARTFEDLKAAGKVLQVGVSNHSPSQLALLQRFHPLAAHQIEFSPLQPCALDDGTLDQCLALGIRPMAWSPLGGGRLFAQDDAAAARVRKVLTELAARHGASPTTLAYAWILRHPAAPLPITGSGRIERLRDAVDALSLELPAEDWYAVLEAARGVPVP